MASLMDYINIKMKTKDLPDKKKFGELMHDAVLTDEEKRSIARNVELAGGYENLAD